MTKKILIIAMTLILCAVLTSSAMAGSTQRHRWEGVAIGVGAAIIGGAIIHGLTHPYRPAYAYRPAHVYRPGYVSGPAPVYVAAHPVYRPYRVWVGGHYAPGRVWVPGHWEHRPVHK